MYRPVDKSQHSFLDLNQPMGLHMNPDNRWIKLADIIPWDVFEEKYAELFPSGTGNVAKPLQMALGALIIQTKFQYPDRELVGQITKNPYLQYFIGLPGYQEGAPFDASTLVDFRRRITPEMLMEANEYMLKHKDDGHKGGGTPPSSGTGALKNSSRNEGENEGTLILDATCAPVNIRYPQDISLLDGAREMLEVIIYRSCRAYGLKLPRRYARTAREDYLKFARAKKNSRQKIRKALRRQLSYVARDIKYLEGFLSEGYAPTPKEAGLIMTIFKLYEQQKYMYDNKLHSVQHRIVSIR